MANTASYRGAVVALALAVWAMPAGLAAQSPSGGTENGEWPVYHGNLAQHHYSKATGAEVGAVYMPAQQSGSPMTYMVGGAQYIVVAISGGGVYSGEYRAFKLPS